MSKLSLTVTTQAEPILLKSIPALRFAFAVAGSLVVGGVLLGMVVHEYFFSLPLVVAGGLLFSAVAGWCPLAVAIEQVFVRRP